MNSFNYIISDRHRLLTDGEGVTTLVVLSGCPLSCSYCINKNILKKGKVKIISPTKLWEELSIDYCYFVATNGGITFGGGEPLLQSRAIKDFKSIIPQEVTVNIETSLNVTSDHLMDVYDITKLFLIDIKDMNNDIYTKYTATDNTKVLENLKLITELGIQDKCVIRIPIIPEYNTEADNQKSIEILTKMGFTKFDRFKYRVKEIKKKN